MSTASERRENNEENKRKKSSPTILREFFDGYAKIFIKIVVLFLISPPLFYAAQFVNKSILKSKFRYKGYTSFEAYFKNEIEFPRGKNRSAFPMEQRPIVENLGNAYNAAIAKGYFSGMEIMTTMMGFMKQFLDFNHTLEPELFDKRISSRTIFNSLNKLGNQREPHGVIGKLFGTLIILFAPMVYFVFLILVPFFSMFSAIGTLFTTINLRSYIKMISVTLSGLATYLSSFVLLIIPTIFVCFIPQIALGAIVFILLILTLIIAIGGPCLIVFFKSVLTSIRIIGAMYWLPEFVNTYFKEQMTQDEKVEYNKIKLQGARYEYPGHARQFASMYSMVFLFMSLLLALKLAF